MKLKILIHKELTNARTTPTDKGYESDQDKCSSDKVEDMYHSVKKNKTKTI